MTPKQNEMVRRLKLAQISGCRADYALLGALPLDRVRGDIRELTDLVTDQAAELATLRAERDELQAAILSSAGAEYILEHPIETDAERMGRKSAVRGMMVRLGLYLQLEQAIDDALKGGA